MEMHTFSKSCAKKKMTDSAVIIKQWLSKTQNIHVYSVQKILNYHFYFPHQNLVLCFMALSSYWAGRLIIQ